MGSLHSVIARLPSDQVHADTKEAWIFVCLQFDAAVWVNGDLHNLTVPARISQTYFVLS